MTAAKGIVGRDVPAARLREVARTSVEDCRSGILVSGQAGIGKTSLIRAVFPGRSSASAWVGWGTCWHGEGAPGFWPWMQAFDDLVRAVGSDVATNAAGADRDRLAALVHEFGPPQPTGEDPDRRRFLLLEAAVRWLEALALHRPVIVVLDDLQWADSSTLDLLDHMIGGGAPTRLLVIGAYRHDELDPARRSRLASLAARVEQIQLDGLPPGAVQELVASICGPTTARELASELHRRTGGHPLFVRELAKLSATGTSGPLPTAVTGAVLRRVEALPEGTRPVLDAASVLGNQLLPDVVARVIEGSVDGVVDACSAAVDAGVLRGGQGEGVWFAHDLFRETVYAELSPSVRSVLHGRVAEALELRRQRGGRVAPGDLARHFAHAVTVTGPARAISWAREAARDERRRSAFDESAAHLRRARMAVADAGGEVDPDLLVQVLMEEAEAQARSGEPGAARELLAEAAVVCPGPAQEADVALAVQRLGAKTAAPRDEIIRQLESALEAVTGLDVARQARVTAALARELQHSFSQDRHRAGPLSEEALTLARRSGDDPTLAACLLARHDALWGPGTGVQRSLLGHEIAVVGARTGDSDRHAEGLLLEANGLLEAGSPTFRPVLDRWFGLLETRNERRDQYLVATRRAALALLAGDAGRAEVLMREAAELGEGIHEPDTGNVLMSQRVALARARDDPETLGTLADDAVRWWTGAPVLAHAVAAGARAAAGDLEGAAREVAMLSDAGAGAARGPT